MHHHSTVDEAYGGGFRTSRSRAEMNQERHPRPASSDLFFALSFRVRAGIETAETGRAADDAALAGVNVSLSRSIPMGRRRLSSSFSTTRDIIFTSKLHVRSKRWLILRAVKTTYFKDSSQ